jgi:hypothetical protein
MGEEAMATGGYAEGLAPQAASSVSPEAFSPSGWVSQFYVFRGEDCLGWDCFQKDGIVVGAGPEADLVLDGYGIAAAQVLVQCNGEQVLIHDLAGNGLVRVNGQPATACLLGPLDVLGVGPYALKVRSRPIRGDSAAPSAERQSFAAAGPPGEPAAFAAETSWAPPTPTVRGGGPRQESRYQATPTSWAALNLQEVDLSVGTPEEDPANESDAPQVPPEAALAEIDTARMLHALDALIDRATRPDEKPREPAVPRTRVVAESPPAGSAPEMSAAAHASEPAPGDAFFSEPWPERSGRPVEPVVPLESTGPQEPDTPAAPPAAPSLAWLGAASAEDEDDEEEDFERDREADFSLADRLAPAAALAPGASAATIIQVVKIRGNQVLDCRYLGPGDAFREGRGRRARPLVERDRKRGAFVYLAKDGPHAAVHTREGAVLETPALCRPEHLVHKRRQIYRCPLPPRSRSVLTVGPTRYVVQEVPSRPELVVPVPTRESRGPIRTFLASSLFHAIALCVGALFISLPSPYEPAPPESRFVQIDTTELEPLMRKPVVAKPTESLEPAPVKPPEPKKLVRPTAKPIAVAKKAPAPKPIVAPTPAPAGPEVAKAPVGAADAGGGHGGNAINRNVNVRQVGILGALGLPDGVNLGASEALAAVTNIDAVRSVRASEAGLKVGGLVGKLGGARIEVPAVGLVNTKGSTQVVVSAGAGGGGTVAALERGSTGKKNVMAMVRADVRAPVQIQGGMSREEVKRVIDAHMDEITYCYETALIEEPTIVGKMAFEWRILESGRVGEVRIQSSSIRNETLHACIRDRIRAWAFPQPRGAEVLVSYPFVFDVVGF